MSRKKNAEGLGLGPLGITLTGSPMMNFDLWAKLTRKVVSHLPFGRWPCPRRKEHSTDPDRGVKGSRLDILAKCN